MPSYPVTDVVSIYHFKRVGGTEVYDSTAAYVNVDACISPTNADIQPSEGGVYSYQIFEVFIWDITVQLNNGDKLVSQNNTVYLVTGSPNLYNNRYAQGIRTLAKVVT